MEIGPTVVDLIENFFGALPSERQILRLSDSQVNLLGELASEFGEAQAMSPVLPDTTYVGGWFGAYGMNAALERDRNIALLYYPRLLVHDPLAEFFFDGFDRLAKLRPIRTHSGSMALSGGAEIWGGANTLARYRHQPEEVRRQLASIIGDVVAAAPLIRSGVLQTRSQWPSQVARRLALETSIRHDVNSAVMQKVAHAYDESQADEKLQIWDNLRGLRVTPGEPVDRRDEPWTVQHEFFYLAKTLGFADSVGATYAPTTSADLALLRAKAASVPLTYAGRRYPARLLEEVAELAVPGLKIDLEDLVKMRADEDAFEEWRHQLSALSRASADDDLPTLRERVADTLQPQIRRLETRSTQSQFMSKIKENSRGLVLTTGAAVFGEIATKGSPVVIASVTAGAGVLSWIWEAYRPLRLGGTDTVLASLMKSRRN